MLGVDGINGEQGESGDDGEDGIPGTQWFKEAVYGPIDNSLGNLGDLFTTITGEVLTKIDDGLGNVTWATLYDTIFGDKGDPGDIGPQGPDGPIGPQGPSGRTILTGTEDPTGDIGEQFDTFHNTETNDYFTKISTGWVFATNFNGVGFESGETLPVDLLGMKEGTVFLEKVHGKLSKLVKNTETDVLEWTDFIDTILGADGNDGENGNEWYEELAGDVLSFDLGKIGDYFVTSTHERLQKIAETLETATSWGTLNLAFGAKGDEGPEGPQGNDGLSILRGSGVPLGTIGVTTQIYIDDDTLDYYIKTSSGWQLSTNIKGPMELCFPILIYTFILKTNHQSNDTPSLVPSHYQSSDCISLP